MPWRLANSTNRAPPVFLVLFQTVEELLVKYSPATKWAGPGFKYKSLSSSSRSLQFSPRSTAARSRRARCGCGVLGPQGAERLGEGSPLAAQGPLGGAQYYPVNTSEPFLSVLS